MHGIGTCRRLAVLGALALTLAACGTAARLPVAAGTGPNPELPPPSRSILPTVNVVTARGWPQGGRPVAAPGTTVGPFAQGLNHPRWLYVLPNGDVLVTETNAPPRPEDGKGIKGWFFKRFQKKAGRWKVLLITSDHCLRKFRQVSTTRR